MVTDHSYRAGSRMRPVRFVVSPPTRRGRLRRLPFAEFARLYRPFLVLIPPAELTAS